MLWIWWVRVESQQKAGRDSKHGGMIMIVHLMSHATIAIAEGISLTNMSTKPRNQETRKQTITFRLEHRVLIILSVANTKTEIQLFFPSQDENFHLLFYRGSVRFGQRANHFRAIGH